MAFEINQGDKYQDAATGEKYVINTWGDAGISLRHAVTNETRFVSFSDLKTKFTKVR